MRNILIAEQMFRIGALLPLFYRVVLTQGMALKLMMAQNAPQIRMAAERHPEHVIDLALVPVGAVIQPCRGGNRFIFGDAGPDPDGA